MKLCTLLVASLLALTVRASAQPLACSDIFSEIVAPVAVVVAEPIAPEAPLEPTTAVPADVQLRVMPMSLTPTETQPESTILANLVEMYLAAPFQGNGYKDLTEKGVLRLARPLSNGETIAFEYRGDRRSGELVFRLTEVSRIFKNGHTVVTGITTV